MNIRCHPPRQARARCRRRRSQDRSLAASTSVSVSPESDRPELGPYCPATATPGYLSAKFAAFFAIRQSRPLGSLRRPEGEVDAGGQADVYRLTVAGAGVLISMNSELIAVDRCGEARWGELRRVVHDLGDGDGRRNAGAEGRLDERAPPPPGLRTRALTVVTELMAMGALYIVPWTLPPVMRGSRPFVV